MTDFRSKAKVTDAAANAAFQEGFNEGLAVANSTQWIYEVSLSFEGNQLRLVQFSSLDQALAEIREHVSNGPDTSVELKVIGVPADGSTPLQAGEEDSGSDDDIVEAEVVEDKKV